MGRNLYRLDGADGAGDTATHDGGEADNEDEEEDDDKVHIDYSYDSDGLLQKIETKTGTTSIAPNRLFAYDALKVLYREAVDTDNDGSIDTGQGKDRVIEYNYQYDYFTGQSLGWWRYEDAHVYNDYGTGTPKKTKVRYSYAKLSGFAYNVLSEVHVGDANAQLVKTKVKVDRARKRRMVIEDHPVKRAV